MNSIEDQVPIFRRSLMKKAPDWEAERCYPIVAMREAAAIGLTGLLTPSDLGGLGMTLCDAIKYIEVLAAADAGFTFALKVHANLTASIAHGDALHRDRYLDDLLSARKIGAFLLTEPDAGSDAAGITTRARRDGTDWIIDGEKSWITNGVAADVLKVFVQTQAELGSRGIAAFLIDADSPGVTRLPAYRMLGAHATGVCGMKFASVRVPEDAMVHEPGSAFKAGLNGINTARTGVAAMCCGIMQSSIDHALAALKSREAFGTNLSMMQGLQWMLADAATDLEASRLLTQKSARALDDDDDAVIACAHAKKFATRAVWKVVSDCMQIHGARGFRSDDDHPMTRHLAGARMTQWLDGATEIQNVVISRSLIFDR